MHISGRLCIEIGITMVCEVSVRQMSHLMVGTLMHHEFIQSNGNLVDAHRTAISGAKYSSTVSTIRRCCRVSRVRLT
jgi:hypothetical protein